MALANSNPAGGVSELVAELREQLFAGNFVPGQRLVEADLAEQFSVSRGTIRSALAELDVEGLIERIPNRGARVRSVSVDEAVEITEVRAALEALCAYKAAASPSEREIANLHEIGLQMADSVKEGNLASYSRFNRQLHSVIIEMSGQKTAAKTISRLRGQVVRFQFQLAQQAGRPADSLRQHLAIIEAVTRRDSKAAAESMRSHLTSVIEAIRAISD